MAPGWYPDPDGTPGLVRWWNGVSWSDVATPAGPGVAVQQPVGFQPRTSDPAVPAPAPPGGGGRTGWIVGLGVLALVLVVVIGLVVAGSGTDEDAVAGPGASAPAP